MEKFNIAEWNSLSEQEKVDQWPSLPAAAKNEVLSRGKSQEERTRLRLDAEEKEEEITRLRLEAEKTIEEENRKRLEEEKLEYLSNPPRDTIVEIRGNQMPNLTGFFTIDQTVKLMRNGVLSAHAEFKSEKYPEWHPCMNFFSKHSDDRDAIALKKSMDNMQEQVEKVKWGVRAIGLIMAASLLFGLSNSTK